MLKRKRNTFALLLAALLLVVLGTAGGGYAHRAAAAGEGSITYTLAYNGRALPGVEITLYKVGSPDPELGNVAFVIDPAYAAANVDLMTIGSAEDLVLAAYRLQTIAKGTDTLTLMQAQESGLQVGAQPGVATVVSDASGVCSFTGLEDGVYLITKTGGDETVKIQPTIVTIPQNTATGIYTDVQVQAKVNIETQPMSITVTKHVSMFAQDMMSLFTLYADSADYTVGLFYDPEGTSPVEGNSIKTIHIEGGSSSSVTFDGLSSGIYYVFELDSHGNPIIPEQPTEDENGVGFTCFISVDDGTSGNVVQLDVNENIFEHDVVVENSYVRLPDGFFINGDIMITKSILRGTDRVDSDRTFYAAVYRRTDEGDILQKIVELKNNDTVTVNVPLGAVGSGRYFFYVEECDADGNAVETSEEFPYTFNLTAGGGVEMDAGDENMRTSYVTITNTEVEVTPTPTPPVETATPTPTPPVETATPTPTQEPTPTLPEYPGPDISTTPTATPTVTVTPPPATVTVTVTPRITVPPTTTPVIVTITSPPNNIIITRPPGGTTTTNVNETITTNSTYAQQNIPAPTVVPPVRTGDDTPIGLYVVLLVAAAGLITILVIRRRGSK